MENLNNEKQTKKTFWQKIKKPFFFTLAFLPIIIVASILTSLYTFDLYPPEMLEEAIAAVGSKTMVILVTVIQNIGMIGIVTFFGYILAEKLGLIRSIKKDGKIKIFEKKAILVTCIVSVICGILFSLDYWTFGAVIPQIQQADGLGLTPISFVASILYGGICEELMLRLFVLSLFAFIIWKVFFRKSAKLQAENNSQIQISPVVFLIANIVASLLFAAGHLPATQISLGITPLILFRCFLYNGGMGYIFGCLYIKYGLQYSMLSHALCHIVSKVIWLLFI